jgi:hypothetical protein
VYFEAIGSEQVLQTFFDFVFSIKIAYSKTTFESIYILEVLKEGNYMKKSKNVFAKFIYISNKKTKKKKKSNS